MMLGDLDATPSLAVKDLQRARRFYEDVVGLTPVGGQGGEMVAYRSGGTFVNVYRSEFAGSNKATALTWSVDDVDQAVRQLKTKGVSFEHYRDMEGMTLQGDVHVARDGGKEMRVAWFKDPDGNILNLVQM